MSEQTIYSRWEFPTNDSFSTLVKRFGGRYADNADGITVEGFDISLRTFAGDRDAIILTYDAESDTYVKLMLVGQKDLQYKNNRKKI